MHLYYFRYDYNIDKNNLIKTLKLFKKYKKDAETKLSFYEWLEEHCIYRYL